MPDAAPGGAAGRSLDGRGGGGPSAAAPPAASASAPTSGLPAGAILVCAKCGREARRPRDCEHTGWMAYCTECYVELHYRLTEPGADAG